jgi:enamine deaminase RidA (YjgF/YER057c/UK114 family)
MVVHNGTVFLAGQVPDTEDGDITTQTREVLASIDALLARAGTDRSRILMAQIFLADLADFPAMNAEWEAWIPQGQAPARATVQAKLARAGWRVEIVVTAAV